MQAAADRTELRRSRILEVSSDGLHLSYASIDSSQFLSDASTTSGDCRRTDCGRLKHVQTRFLRLQETVADGGDEMRSVDTIRYTSDLGTKYWDK